jgi:hypothetical protein
MVGPPDLGPPSVEEDAFRLEGAKGLDSVRHQMQNPGFVVLAGEEHGEDEQAPEGGQLLPLWITAA